MTRKDLIALGERIAQDHHIPLENIRPLSGRKLHGNSTDRGHVLLDTKIEELT